MARPKKDSKTGKRKDEQYEYKGFIGTTVDGRPKRKSFYSPISLDDAKSKHAQFLVDKKAAEITGTVFVEKGVTFAEWAERWLLVYKKPNVDENTYLYTYENTVRVHLIPYFKNADLRSIQPLSIQKFFSEKASYSESMLDKFHMCLVSIFDAAIENDLCYKNPAKSKTVSVVSSYVKTPKRVFTPEQLDVVRERCSMPQIVCALGSGMRPGEICGLMWTDIDLKNRTYSVNRSIADVKGGGITINPPKWKGYRTNPFEVVDDFYNLLVELNKEKKSVYVFPDDDGGAMSPRKLRDRIKSHFSKTLPSDFPVLTPHELRHTYGTNLYRRGVDIYAIQKIMGHKDIKMTTELYVHNEVDNLKRALKKADKTTKKTTVKQA